MQEPARPQRTGGVHEINWLRTTSFTEGYLRGVSDVLRTGVLYFGVGSHVIENHGYNLRTH
jgi:hypothetical protein